LKRGKQSSLRESKRRVDNDGSKKKAAGNGALVRSVGVRVLLKGNQDQVLKEEISVQKLHKALPPILSVKRGRGAGKIGSSLVLMPSQFPSHQ